MTTREITKRIQEAVGAVTDGVWGKNTANAVWTYIQATEGKEEQTDETQPEEEPVQESQNWELDPSDAITPEVHRKCIQTLNVFETGSPEGDYSNVSVYKDGGGGAYYQITYGASQTTQDGNLDKLLYRYVDAAADDSAVAALIQRYLPTKGNRSLCKNDSFIAALMRAGQEPIMQKLQDEFFDEEYFIPAYKWFKENGFTLPLSMLVIYDSFIHSGGILSFLRKRFSEVPPAKGGDEKAWVKSYVDTRHAWLANHCNKVLRNTVYRMDTMQACIKAENWNLSSPYEANGKTIS